MDFALSEEQVMIRDMCRGFADDMIVPQAEEIDIAGVTFATLKLDGWTPDASDLGNRIAEVWGMPACVRFDGSRGEVHMLRSERGVGMDVERVAREMGGGGHKHAAAFTKA